MGRRARAERVCERAVVASIALLGASCLNELEPSIASNLCRGNVPDGVLDSGEECDDANGDAGDGCDLGCRVTCPADGFKDPVNAHCYLPVPALAGSLAGAEDLCRSTSGALPTRLLTVRSRREADFLRDVVYGGRPPGERPLVRTGYSFGLATLQLDVAPFVVRELNFRQAAPSTFRAEPGLLAYYTQGAANSPEAKSDRPTPEQPCTGCYGRVEVAQNADGEAWWGARALTEPPDQGLAFDAERDVFAPVSLDQPDGPGLETLCERVPNSPPRNEGCADCPGGPRLRFRLGPSIYSYFDEALTWADADARCRSLGATLWIINDEDERERVVRLLAPGSAPSPPPTPSGPTWPIPTRWGLWVGATTGPDGVWLWSDGTPAVGDHAVPWALEPIPSWNTNCGYVALRGDAFSLVEAASSDVFAVGLVIPSNCDATPAPNEPAFPGLLCEEPAPP